MATIRSPSLSQIAGRQVQLTLPPSSEKRDPIEDGGTLTQSETVSAVDLDQLFNTLSPKTINDFKHVIKGLATSYEGVGPQANKGLHYLNPFLSTSRQVFAELNSDQAAFENLIVDTSQLSGALAERAPDISAAGREPEPDDERDRRPQGAARRSGLAAPQLPARVEHDLRQPARGARRSRSAGRRFEAGGDPAAPVSRARCAPPPPTRCRRSATSARSCVAAATRNDLVELTRLQPALAKAAVGSGSPDCGGDSTDLGDLASAQDDNYTQGAFGEAVCALRNSAPQLSMFRAYTPELVGWFDDFGHSGFIDAIGGIGRIGTTLNPFSISLPGGTPNLARPAHPRRADRLAGHRQHPALPRWQRAPGQ